MNLRTVRQTDGSPSVTTEQNLHRGGKDGNYLGGNKEEILWDVALLVGHNPSVS